MLERPVAAQSPQSAPSGPKAAKRRHLDELDLFRVLTFAAVVMVHTVGATSQAGSRDEGAATVLLHFTREAFFFLTGFVLIYSQGSKPLRPLSFWRRRFKLIGIPYLAWTAIYVAYVSGWAPHTFVYDALTGQGYYQLYFLLVSMQVYAAFPLVLWIIRSTKRWPWAVVGAAAVFQLGFDWWMHNDNVDVPFGSFGHWYASWSYVLAPSYLLYLVAGAVVAQNLAAAQAFLLRHKWWFVGGGIVGLAVTEGWFQHLVSSGVKADDGWRDASAVFQPVMVVCSLSVIALLATASTTWSRRVAPGGRWHRAVLWGSSASFGVYLIHPLVLDQVETWGFVGPKPTILPQPWATIAAWALTLAISVAIVAVLRKTPLALPLTGRPWQRPSRPARAAGGVAGDPAQGAPAPVAAAA